MGQMLATAAMARYNYVTFSPLYDFFKRGGVSECTVIFSDTEITSPILSRVEAVIVFEPSQLKAYEEKVRPGGFVIVESVGLKDKVERGDIKVYEVPGIDMASQLGSMQVANLILLGAYIRATGALPADVMESELMRRLAIKEDMLATNKKAFGEGIRLAGEMAG